MAKVVKIAAVVAGIALAIPTGGGSLLAVGLGVSAFAATAIVAGLTIGASLLAKKPKAPQTSSESLDRLNVTIDPRTTRKSVWGITAMATDIRDQEYTDSQTYLHRFVVVASHKVHAIKSIWFDDKLAWTVIDGVQGEFAGYLTITPVLEGSAGNAINISARMGDTRRYTGLAYVHLRYKLTGNTKKTESPFAQSVPQRVTIEGEGAYFYDPRLDSTVPGGSGSCRADDQSTWIWNEDGGRNAALGLLWRLLGWRISGLLAVGHGIPARRFDMPSFITAANLCDEAVDGKPRYCAEGVWSEGDSPTTVLDSFKAAMNAELDDMAGRLRVQVIHNDLAAPVAHFTEDDVLGPVEWRRFPSLDETFNVVRGTYPDPSTTSLYQPIEYPAAEMESPDGIERVFPLNQGLVQDPGQCHRLAVLRLNRQKYGGLWQAEYKATAWRVQKGDIITHDFGPLNVVGAKFRVAEIEHREDGRVPMMLREENSAIYGAVTVPDAIEPVDNTPFNPALDPIRQGIEGVIGGARTLRNSTIAYPLSSDDDSIDVVAFDGILNDTTAVSFPAATIGSLASGVDYGVFYSVSDLTYSTEAYPADTLITNSNLVFVGWQATSTAGTYPTSPTPPPGSGGDGRYPVATEPL